MKTNGNGHLDDDELIGDTLISLLERSVKKGPFIVISPSSEILIGGSSSKTTGKSLPKLLGKLSPRYEHSNSQ